MTCEATSGDEQQRAVTMECAGEQQAFPSQVVLEGKTYGVIYVPYPEIPTKSESRNVATEMPVNAYMTVRGIGHNNRLARRLWFNPTTGEFFDHRARIPKEPAVNEDLDDRTATHGEQDNWCMGHLPDILYVLRPEQEHAKSRRIVPQTPFEIFGQTVCDYKCLPLRISSEVEGWRLEAWFRMDRRITPEDIIDRVNPKFKHRISIDTIENRRDYFRELYHVANWENSKSIANVAKLVKDIGLDPDLNTTRGLTAGLIDPAKGEAGGRIQDICCPPGFITLPDPASLPSFLLTSVNSSPEKRGSFQPDPFTQAMSPPIPMGMSLPMPASMSMPMPMSMPMAMSPPMPMSTSMPMNPMAMNTMQKPWDNVMSPPSSIERKRKFSADYSSYGSPPAKVPAETNPTFGYDFAYDPQFDVNNYPQAVSELAEHYDPGSQTRSIDANNNTPVRPGTYDYNDYLDTSGQTFQQHLRHRQAEEKFIPGYDPRIPLIWQKPRPKR